MVSFRYILYRCHISAAPAHDHKQSQNNLSLGCDQFTGYLACNSSICVIPPLFHQDHLCARERESLYIFSSHLGLIRCLTPVGGSAIIYSQAFLDKHCNTTNIILPHKLNHGSCMLSKQPYMPVTNSLKPWAFKYNMLLITQVFTRTQSAYSMQPRDTLPTAKIPCAQDGQQRRHISSFICQGRSPVG